GHLPQGQLLRIGLFVRRPPPFQPGTALVLDWSAHFSDKEATSETWRDTLLPGLDCIAKALRQHAPGREAEAFGLPTLPAAVALGGAFLSPSGLRAAWGPRGPRGADQMRSLSQPKEDSGFKARIMSKQTSGRDIAVLGRCSPPIRRICRHSARSYTSRGRAPIRTSFEPPAKRPTLHSPSKTACAPRG